MCNTCPPRGSMAVIRFGIVWNIGLKSIPKTSHIHNPINLRKSADENHPPNRRAPVGAEEPQLAAETGFGSAGEEIRRARACTRRRTVATVKIVAARLVQSE